MKLSFQTLTNANGKTWAEVYTEDSKVYMAELRRLETGKWVLSRSINPLTVKDLKQIYRYLKELNRNY